MAAPLGTVWLVEQKRYRSVEEHTTGPVPENLWQFGVQVSVRSNPQLPRRCETIL